MNARLLFRSVGLILSAAALVIACTKSPPPRDNPAAPPSALASSSPHVAAPDTRPILVVDASPLTIADAGGLPFVAWTDPRGVLALLRHEPMPSEREDPRSCQFEVPDQSCVPGSDAIDWDCKQECANGCDKCAAPCLTTLDACREKCNGTSQRDNPSPCERTCGEAAGACVQACIGTKDRCFTGECATRIAKFNKMIDTNYGCNAKLSPLEICKRTTACFETCDAIKSATQGLACMSACKKKLAAGCNDVLLGNVDARNCYVFDMGP